MNITVNEILNAVPVLQKVSNQPFKGKVVFQIVRLMKAFDEEVKNFEEARKKIVEKYCERDENGEMITTGNQVKIKEDEITECNNELTDLLLSEVEVNVEPLAMDSFENVELTPSEVIALGKIVE